MTTENNFECKPCAFKTNLKTNLERHLNSNRHKKEIGEPLTPKITKKENNQITENETDELKQEIINLKNKILQLENDLNLKQLENNLLKQYQHQPHQNQIQLKINEITQDEEGEKNHRKKNAIAYLNKERADISCDNSIQANKERFKIEDDDLMVVFNSGFVTALITVMKRETKRIGGKHLLPFSATCTRKNIIYVKEEDGWKIDSGNLNIKILISHIVRFMCCALSPQWMDEHSHFSSKLDKAAYTCKYEGYKPKISGVAAEISRHLFNWDNNDLSMTAQEYCCEKEAIKSVIQFLSIDSLLCEN